MANSHRPPLAMSGESSNSQKRMLAAAIAEGQRIRKWAETKGVPERTAYYWAAEPLVRSETESIHRRALDEAIGRLAARATWAVEGIVNLLILDGGNLLIHPRCTFLKEALGSYRRRQRGGQWIDFPADGHPEEDLIDALRGGVRDALPEGNALAPYFPRIRAARTL